MVMFEGEKRDIFWIGLIILALASVILFATLWQFMFEFFEIQVNVSWTFRNSFPIIVGAIVFIFIGLYMMKSGVKKP